MAPPLLGFLVQRSGHGLQLPMHLVDASSERAPERRGALGRCADGVGPCRITCLLAQLALLLGRTLPAAADPAGRDEHIQALRGRAQALELPRPLLADGCLDLGPEALAQ